ncbi:MAG: hypothetical protein GC190_12120 [Alphaproteobacteria bacterium]|nr:hypothetical protein [Alphaproteobacteria bacterium]
MFQRLSKTIRRLRRANPLLTLLIVHAAIGFVLSAAFVATIVVLDTGRLAHLFATNLGWPFALVLWFFIGLTFASVLMGSAIMSLNGDDRTRGRRSLRRPSAGEMIESRVTVRK